MLNLALFALNLTGMEPSSHEERKQFADSTKNLPAWAQLSVEEIEMMEEQAASQPVAPANASEGIASMQRRIHLLNQQIAQVLNAQEEQADNESLVAKLSQDFKDLSAQLRLARERLAHYQAQQKSRN